MNSIYLLQYQLTFHVFFLTLYQPAISSLKVNVNDDDPSELGWTPFIWRGEILRRNRWLSYAIRGRIHSWEDLWVYDCRVEDAKTNIAVDVRHFFSRKVALNMTVDLLFQKLESMGIVSKVKSGGLNVEQHADSENAPDRKPNADDGFTAPQQEHETEVSREDTHPIAVTSKGFENDDQFQVVSLAFGGDDNPRSYTSIKTEDISLEERVVPDSDGFYKHLSVQEAMPSISQLNPSENYVLFESREKGLVYILNNNCFLRRSPKTRQRRGSEVDVSNARHVFTEIGYEPVVYRNLSAEETLKSLDELVKRINAEGARHSSVVLVFMSHGDRRGILGNDDIVITLPEITDKLSGRRCPALVGKPKILFFQACRGHNVTESATDTDSSPINDGNLSDSEAETESLLPAPSKKLSVSSPHVDVDGDIPNNADMFVAFATSEGYFSFRDCKHGSWFIQALCEELLSNAHIDDLDTIMNKVTGRVIKYIAFVKGEFGRKRKSLQTPEISKKGITKKIFFMPKFPPKEDDE